MMVLILSFDNLEAEILAFKVKVRFFPDTLYAQTFSCEFSLHWYPFDFQTCYLKIKPSAGLVDSVHLTADEFLYEGPDDLTEFNIKSLEMMVEEEVLLVEMTVRRRLFRLVLTTFLPTIIINIIGHTSNYFKEFFFEGLMGMQITVMLMLTTMFLSINDSLPPTAYVKMIDCWLIFNLLKPFVDIIVQTYIESLRENPDARDARDSDSETLSWAE